MMHSMVFYLGLWNPAGAQRKVFKSKEERSNYAKEASQTGYVCWDAGFEARPVEEDDVCTR